MNGTETLLIDSSKYKKLLELEKQIKIYLKTENSTKPQNILENITTRRMIMQLLKEGDQTNGK